MRTALALLLFAVAQPVQGQGPQPAGIRILAAPTTTASRSTSRALIPADSGKKTHWLAGFVVGTAVGTALGINAYHQSQRDGWFDPTFSLMFCVMLFSSAGILIGEAWKY